MTTDTDIIRQLRDRLEKANEVLYMDCYDDELKVNELLIAAADAHLSAAPQASEPAAPAGLCRGDGRCQCAIDSGAEGLGHCPQGKCVKPAALAAPNASLRKPFPEFVPPIGTDCVVRVRYRQGQKYHYAVDRWEMCREDPTGMGGPTIETGADWCEHCLGEDVSHFLQLPPIDAVPVAAPAAGEVAADIVRDAEPLTDEALVEAINQAFAANKWEPLDQDPMVKAEALVIARAAIAASKGNSNE